MIFTWDVVGKVELKFKLRTRIYFCHLEKGFSNVMNWKKKEKEI